VGSTPTGGANTIILSNRRPFGLLSFPEDFVIFYVADVFKAGLN